MNKKVVYTIITNNYDKIKEPKIINKDWDYIVFSDTQQKSSVWHTILIESDKNPFSQRINKIYNKYIFENYDYSLYIDGTMTINCDINSLFEKWKDYNFVLMKHPERNCIYEEAMACLMFKKDTRENMIDQIYKYKKKGYPENNGLVATGIIFRKHTKEVVDFSRKWTYEIKRGSHRDQLSFNYVAYQNNLDFITVPYNLLIGDKFIKSHHN